MLSELHVTTSVFRASEQQQLIYLHHRLVKKTTTKNEVRPLRVEDFLLVLAEVLVGWHFSPGCGLRVNAGPR